MSQEAHVPEWMQVFMAQQQQQMMALQEQQHAQIQALQAAVAATNAEVQSLRQTTLAEDPRPPTPTPEAEVTRPRRTKAILPDPPKFDGTRSEYEGWRSLIKDKIEVDGEVIGSDRNQFIYISSRLEGKGLQLALTFITMNRDAPGVSAAPILDYLDGIFGDRHKAQRAVETLRTMKQGPKEFFSAFLPRFEKALADAGGMAWPDEVKRSHLDGALTFELRRLTITMPVVASYGDYVNELLRLSDLYRATMRHAPKEQPAARQGASDTMDWEPTQATRATSAQGGQKQRRALWVSQEEIGKRRQEGRCLRCGTSKHRIAECEFLGARPPRETPSARGPRAASGKAVVEPQLEPEGLDSEGHSLLELN